MATNQENIISTAQTATAGSNYTYIEAIYALAVAQSVTNTNINGAIIEYLQSKLSSSNTNINDLLAEYSAANFDGNVNAINDLSL